MKLLVFIQQTDNDDGSCAGEDMIRYKSISNKGSRIVNEDCVGMFKREEEYGFFLADGLGGHGRGETASQEAVKQAILQFKAGGCKNQTLAAIFEAGQKEIQSLQKKEQNLYSMKTTMTALLLGRDFVQWGHIGDSRIYWFWNGKLMGRTLDHSVPQMLVTIGEIKEEEIRNHPDRNRLLRVMGMEWEGPEYQIAEKIPLRFGQAFLMCSDGFWELIEEECMVKLLRQASSVEEWMDRMAAQVQKNGEGREMDNYSAVAVWVTRK